MTNTLAIALGLLIVGLLGLDYLVFGSDHLIFLGRKLFELIEWLAFWR